MNPEVHTFNCTNLSHTHTHTKQSHKHEFAKARLSVVHYLPSNLKKTYIKKFH